METDYTEYAFCLSPVISRGRRSGRGRMKRRCKKMPRVKWLGGGGWHYQKWLAEGSGGGIACGGGGVGVALPVGEGRGKR